MAEHVRGRGQPGADVSVLRKALDDRNGGAQYIETVPKGGYRFTAAVVDHTPAARVESHAVEPLSSRLASRVALGRILALLATAAVGVTLMLAFQRGLLLLHLRSSAAASVPRIQSLAVLPLENLSGDPAQDYFADGMTDQLITNLGQIGSLRVISRTSAMQYRGVHKSLPQIARELRVDAIIEGTVLRSGDKVRITAQLIQASEDRHLWAQSFEGDLKDVVVVQDNISRAIASQIQMTLLPREQVRPGIDRPLNWEAYEAYLKGEYYLNRFTAESIRQALAHFQQAVEKDPRYAPAYVKMSGCYRMLANMNVLPKAEGNEKAKALVAKALELDPNFGAAHAGVGWGLLLYDLDFASAEGEFKRAVELNPNSVEGHEGLGDYYAAVGQVDEAVHELQRARELDPLASIVNHDLCQTLTFARRYDEALAQCKANLELDPNSVRSIWVIENVYAAKGMESEALAYLLRGLRAAGASPSMMGAVQAGASRGGLKGCWQALIPFALDGFRNGGMDAFNVAAVYTRAGDADAALLWLHKAVETRSFGITFLGVDPTFDSMRAEPRFLSLLRSIGITQHSYSN